MTDRIHLTVGTYILLMVGLGFGIIACLALQLATILGGLTP